MDDIVHVILLGFHQQRRVVRVQTVSADEVDQLFVVGPARGDRVKLVGRNEMQAVRNEPQPELLQIGRERLEDGLILFVEVKPIPYRLPVSVAAASTQLEPNLLVLASDRNMDDLVEDGRGNEAGAVSGIEVAEELIRLLGVWLSREEVAEPRSTARPGSPR